MAKTQKTVFLPEDLCTLIQAYADTIGTTFTKVLGAALLEFFFRNEVGPDATWLTYIVSLEKGHTPLWKIPSEYRKNLAERYRAEAKSRLHHGAENVRSFTDHAKLCDGFAAFWDRSIEEQGGELCGLKATVLHKLSSLMGHRWLIDMGIEASDGPIESVEPTEPDLETETES